MQARSSTRLFYALVATALVSLAIGLGGNWLGRVIAAGGHTESREQREIVIGNNVLLVPENTIRFRHARRDGVQTRLDLYLRWPDMEGYTLETRDDFNNTGGAGRIIFISFEPRMLTRDMSGRLEPIYTHLLAPGTGSGPGGLDLHRFNDEAGYVDEILVVGRRAPEEPFVARCLSGEMAARSLAPCQRDIHFGEDISLVYRFPEELLGTWRDLEGAVTAKAATFLQTGD